MPVPRTLAELPFLELPARELLALDRDEPDPEYAGYGWARVPRLYLATNDAGPARRIDDALVIAVHAADDGAPLPNDVELDFEVEDAVFATHASTFLAAWLPRLPQDVRAIVLVMCNPHGAELAAPPGLARPLYYGSSDVFAWLDLDEAGDRIRLVAASWRKVSAVANELEVRRPQVSISDEDKLTYAGIYVLKKMDLKPEDGGLKFPIKLPTELSPLEEVLHHLAVEGYVEMNTRKDRYDLTKAGIAYLGRVIDEATDLMDEFDDDEMPEVVEELRRRRLDPLRARFVWGWYDGEFDDLVLWQEQRGIKPVERMWALYLLGDEFWTELANEIEGD